MEARGFSCSLSVSIMCRDETCRQASGCAVRARTGAPSATATPTGVSSGTAPITFSIGTPVATQGSSCFFCFCFVPASLLPDGNAVSLVSSGGGGEPELAAEVLARRVAAKPMAPALEAAAEAAMEAAALGEAIEEALPSISPLAGSAGGAGGTRERTAWPMGI